MKAGKTKLFWATLETDLLGNALGYATHNKFMKKHCEKYFEYSKEADIALTITPANFFIPQPGKFNILFTMWETPDVPNEYIVGLDRADLIIVPTRFCRDLFKGITDTPIVICNEGIESDSYPYFQRHLPMGEEKFRFLWVGAPNPRKGFPLILESIKFFEKFPRVEIYLKTTFQKPDRASWTKKLWQQRKIMRSTEHGRADFKEMFGRMRDARFGLEEEVKVTGTHNNVVMDTRRLPFKDLIDLYNSAHAFVLPHCGEGWGLTLCEAMATGAPCISGAYTGCSEFFDHEVGFPIGYELRENKIANYGNMKSQIYVPSLQDTIQQMVNVIQNYEYALNKGKRASERVHRKFTWERAASRMNDIIQDIEAKHLCVK